MLSDAGIYLKEGNAVGSAIIEVTSSTNNKAKVRDPERYIRLKKGKQ